MQSLNSRIRAGAFRQEAERLRREGSETQDASRRIDLLIRALHYDVLAAAEEQPGRPSDDFHRGWRYPPDD